MKESQLWFLQLITGVLLLVLAFSHISTFSSLIGVGYKVGLEYNSLVDRAKPLFYVIFYSVFLTVLMYHANYGLRTLLIELSGGRYKQLITVGVFIVAVITYLYGLWEIIIFHFMVGG